MYNYLQLLQNLQTFILTKTLHHNQILEGTSLFISGSLSTAEDLAIVRTQKRLLIVRRLDFANRK